MINRLHRLLPEGLVADAAWFTRMGYPSSLRSRYLASGWLQPVARGVFRRPLHKPGLEETVAPLRWQHIVISLQMVLDQPVAVGGRTALEMHGFAHYLSSEGPREFTCMGTNGRRGGSGSFPSSLPSSFTMPASCFALSRSRSVSKGSSRRWPSTGRRTKRRSTAA